MKKYRVVYKTVFDDDTLNKFASSKYANIPEEKFIDAQNIDEAKIKVKDLENLRMKNAQKNMPYYNRRTFSTYISEVRELNANQ
jgi:hypothetical protein